MLRFVPPLAVLFGALFGLVSATVAWPSSPSWEIWHDLRRLAWVEQGDRSLLRSSHCLDGCAFDRHSADDWRYLRLDGEEGVIFEETGAGAITRIWMTMGVQGASVPLDPEVRLRVYLDGASTPTIDLPLPALFDGSSAPFFLPLVGNQAISSGGNFSYVPIPFREGCRVVLVGAHASKIWYQISYRRLASAEGVATFTGQEDLSGWSALLDARGTDPWPLAGGHPPSSEILTGNVSLPIDKRVILTDLDGPDTLTGLRLILPSTAWPEVDLELTFDGETRAEMPLADFFASGRPGASPARTLLVGSDAAEVLYSFFPMPFFHSAQIALRFHGTGKAPTAEWELRRDNAPPDPRSALFEAIRTLHPETSPGSDIPFLDVNGAGRWVGFFAELGSVGDADRRYLEGDERIYVDGATDPTLYGTGTEDIFNGGFYFDGGPFQLGLHGSPDHFLTPGGEDVTSMYRLMLSDAVTFASSLRAGLEGGPTNDRALRARFVTWGYRRAPRLWRWDVLDLGDATSRAAHQYTADGGFTLRPLNSFFADEPPTPAAATVLERGPGTASFRVPRPPGATTLRLRRRFDAGHGAQAAEVRLNGAVAGSFAFTESNPDRRFRELDLDLAPGTVDAADNALLLSVEALPDPTAATPDATLFTAIRYELWSDVEPIFIDGFESGTATAWSIVFP